MRTVKPNLNDGYYDSEYLRAFQFRKLGDNVRIHRTVVLPDPPTVSIGNNVVIGPLCALIAKEIDIGDNVKVNALTLIDGDVAVIPANSVVESNFGAPEVIAMDPDEE